MNEYDFLLHQWGARYYEDPRVTREMCEMMKAYYDYKIDSDQEIKAINNTQHNQLNIIDEAEKIKLMAKTG